MNYTTINVFNLTGFSDIPKLNILIFILFLCIYVITMLGNGSIIIAYRFSPNLHTPMYFILANFSFQEICSISVTVPKMLSDFLMNSKTISFYGCATQMYWFLSLAGTECCMLAVMAYDRYNAIRHPLLYNMIMSKRACIHLIAMSWLFGAVQSLIHTALTFSLSFCNNTINHFFCDIPPLLKLACTVNLINEIAIFAIGGSLIAVLFLLTIISYIQIISTLLKIHSSSINKKALSTCISHLTVVSIYYGSGSFMYLRPQSKHSMDQDKLIAILYTAVVPLLNPFIYGLRKCDIKIAVKKIIRNIMGHQKF
ncbi:olfactory receptor 5I1-like [Rhinophrynus dorsalis]